ncbi:hypothetical protein PQE71_gp146 [Bacillus phage Izhevsk]|uniref:Uncharacterized protein n=1 Tax=Bacillus phage Izhevsk TaxID=2724322 RepID=A0A6H0X692_9CAUD|nr:hypothetical protein PQE71_gp146 [Bacillus phage Izhevsk]QIW89828.1 hypothetical protein Izhevsk_147 [Bacillus phage Izhevsk]
MYTYHENRDSQMLTRTQLRNVASLAFVEITSGLYQVNKDRMGHMGRKSFVDVREVSSALNQYEKVVVFGANGGMYSNTEFNII